MTYLPNKKLYLTAILLACLSGDRCHIASLLWGALAREADQ